MSDEEYDEMVLFPYIDSLESDEVIVKPRTKNFGRYKGFVRDTKKSATKSGGWELMVWGGDRIFVEDTAEKFLIKLDSYEKEQKKQGVDFAEKLWGGEYEINGYTPDAFIVGFYYASQIVDMGNEATKIIKDWFKPAPGFDTTNHFLAFDDEELAQDMFFDIIEEYGLTAEDVEQYVDDEEALETLERYKSFGSETKKSVKSEKVVLTDREVSFYIHTEKETTPIENSFDDDEMIETVHLNAENNPDWGWVTVFVHGFWDIVDSSSTEEVSKTSGTPLYAFDTLGESSYESIQDFKRGGYWEDMKNAVIAELNSQLAGLTLQELARQIYIHEQRNHLNDWAFEEIEKKYPTLYAELEKIYEVED
jgi:hypothetical protein